MINRYEFALGINLKLSSVKNLRRNKGVFVCAACKERFEKKDYPYFFGELAYRQLAQPVVCGGFTLTKVPVVILRYCVPCAKRAFPESFKKPLTRQG